MGDDKSNKDKEVTPKGAVEVGDKELDQAAGGADPQASAFVVTFDRPIDPASKDPTISEATFTEKKI